MQRGQIKTMRRVYNLQHDMNYLQICKEENYRYHSLNKDFHHFFTAGDPEQFIMNISLESRNEIRFESLKNKLNINASSPGKETTRLSDVMNTFDYLFHKFKKGCFIQIRNNEMQTFLPFSKINYRNNWSHLIKIDPYFGKNCSESLKFKKMLEYINKGTKYENFEINFQRNFDEWYGNNGIFRFEYPLIENDSGYPMMYDMFSCLVQEREVLDWDGFCNKRDAPLVKTNGTEAYVNIFGKDEKEIESKYQENLPKFLPVLSMNASDRFLDHIIPTWEDWRYFEFVRNGKVFMEKKNKEYKTYPKPNEFFLNFSEKIPIAVFRGSSTGVGVDSKTNLRLFVCELNNKKENKDIDGIPFLDAKLTSFNRRPRKIKEEPFVRTILIEKYKNFIGNPLNYQEQSKYKYVLHIPGHSCAYRLTLELFFNSVILYYPSDTHLWYFPMLKPYIHYIPIKRFDAANLFETIQWCKENEVECEKIANNAREFALQYLNSDYALDYLQNMINSLAVSKPIEYSNHLMQHETNMKGIIQKTISKFDGSPILSAVNTYWIHDHYYFQVYLHHLANENKLFDFLESTCRKKNAIASKNTCIDFHEYRGMNFICKNVQYNFRRDDLQQLVVGYEAINKLIENYPQHFVYTYYHIQNDSSCKILVEYKEGRTLLEILLKQELQLQDLLLIWVEICCILQIAQNLFAFVHSDLMSWNILIRKLPKAEFIFFEELNFGFYRKYIPILIDYGDSHIVFENKSIYNTIPFRASEISDVVFMVVKSTENFLHHFQNEIYIHSSNQDLKEKKFKFLKKKQEYLDIFKTILGFFQPLFDPKLFRKYQIKTYTNEVVKTINQDLWSLRNFCKKNSKYSTLLENVEQYPKKTPFQFVQFLLNSKLISKHQITTHPYHSDVLYTRVSNIPHHNFYRINRALLKILQEQKNTIIFHNQIAKFEKKVKKQLKSFEILLNTTFTDLQTNSRNQKTFLFLAMFQEQCIALQDIMKANFNTPISEHLSLYYHQLMQNESEYRNQIILSKTIPKIKLKQNRSLLFFLNDNNNHHHAEATTTTTTTTTTLNHFDIDILQIGFTLGRKEIPLFKIRTLQL